MSDYKVPVSRQSNIKNREPEKIEDPAITKLRDLGQAQKNVKLAEIDGRPVNPSKELIMKNAKLPYTEAQECEFCHRKIVFRKSDEKYDTMKGRRISIVKDTGGYPIWVPIDPVASGSNYYGNYGDDYGGNIKPHICKVEAMGSDDLRAFVKRNYEKQIEFEKWVIEQLKDIRETAQFKPVVLNWRYREE